MARPWELLSRHRRVVLPVVLWSLLAGTVGLAVVVRGALDRSLGIELGPEQRTGTLRVRLPEGWVTVHDTFPGGSRILAHEDVKGEPEEHLEIYHLVNPRGLSAQELLLLPEPFGIPRAYYRESGPGIRSQPNPTGAMRKWDRLVMIGGAEGVMREGFQFTLNQSLAWRDLFAAAALPGEQAVIVKLRTVRPVDELESRREPLLLRRIAESIVVEAPPALPVEMLPEPVSEPVEADPREYDEPLRE